MSRRDIWRSADGNPLKFQRGDHVRILSQEPSEFSRGYVASYSEGGDSATGGGITYNLSRDGIHNRNVAEDDLEKTPEFGVTYTAIGYAENGGSVNYQWGGDIMDVRADGIETIEKARARALELFDQDDRVAFVSISESIQKVPGCGWHPGRTVFRVDRPTA